jgi:hypothetical protein
VTALLCVLVTGCGGNGSGRTQSNSNIASGVPDTTVGVAMGDSGKIVDPEEVPGTLRHTGFHIVFRSGPLPTDFVSAIYGTASNAHGISINFGFFFVPNDRAGVYDRPELKKLVPDATAEGSTSGESYIVITSAGARSKRESSRTREEFSIAGELHWAVAGLAPKALREEGP